MRDIMLIENKSKKPSIIKSFLIALSILVGLIALTVLGFGQIKLPGWPFCFFAFYYLTFAHMAKDKLLITAVGGFIGLTVGFSQGLLSALVGDGPAWLGTIILLIVLITIVVDGRIKVIDPLCMMMVTVLTGHGLHANIAPEAYLPAVGSYAVAVVAFAIVVNLISKRAKVEPAIEEAVS